jgi:hypothetical protein
MPFGINGSATTIVTVDLRTYDYGRGYGLGGCAAHDALQPPSCRVVLSPQQTSVAVQLPSWCFLPWCYVNGSACEQRYEPTPSTYDWGTPVPDLHYSYKTCNASDLYTAAYRETENVKQSLARAHRRQEFYLHVLLPVLLGCSVLSVCISIWAVRLYFRRRHRAGRLRCVSDNTFATAKQLAADLSYHLFLSHAWQHGQDQMRLVKDRLGEMLPELKVFLDVDDMREGNGATYVDQSVTVLAFVTAGYFESLNCTREVR